MPLLTAMNRYLKKILSVLSCAVLCATFIIAMVFSAPEIQALPQSDRTVAYFYTTRGEDGQWKTETITAIAGKDFTAVSIADLGKLNKITKVNYVPNKFLSTTTLDPNIQIVDLEKPFEFAEKGTLIFVILNLDPMSPDFYDQSDRLDQYKIGSNWRFTMSLPKIFSASNVYLRSTLVTRNGDIEDYDFTLFNDNYDVKTDTFSPMTQSTSLDLSFYTRQVALGNAIIAAQIITVHYQSTGSAYSGIMDCPLIGTESAIKGIKETSQNLLITFGIVAAVVLAIFVTLSILERSKEFVSAIVWIFGITILLISRFLLSGATGVPLLWSAIALSMSFVILGGAQLAMGRSFGKFPAKYVFPALSLIGALFAFICPFIPFAAANAMRITCMVIKAIGAAALLTFIGFAIARKNDKHGILQTMCASIIAVAVIASLFTPVIFPAQFNPMFWLCVATTLTTFISVFIVFMKTRASNVYLTANLHKEVERQVKDIKAVIAERDSLLQFVSHDMKKPLVTSASMIDTLIDRERDEEQVKALHIVKQNTERVVNNLSEIALYAKFNYIAEPSQVVDLSDICKNLGDFHYPDCNANGIVLKNLADKSIKAFVKKQGLENVISNIIINAIEHASCSAITLSLKTDKNNAVLCVADNGKGIDKDLDVFRPYVSENDSETGGLGLYICKNIIESMNGELTYETGKDGTIFYISLLKA